MRPLSVAPKHARALHPADLLAGAQNLRGACALARGDPTTAKACYTQALAAAERLSLPVETGRAQTALAQLEQAEAEPREEMLALARESLRAAGAVVLARRVPEA